MASTPTSSLKTRLHEGKEQIFDPIRKKWVAATPEEVVRQQLIAILTEKRGYSKNLLAVEKGIEVFGASQRFDLVAYNKQGEPTLLAECKAPSIPLDQRVFDQVARYNIALKVPYLVITNGVHFYACRVNHENGDISFVENIPDFSSL
jgi:hypothetical protein